MSKGRTSHVGRWRTVSTIFAAVMAATVSINVFEPSGRAVSESLARPIRPRVNCDRDDAASGR